MEIGDRTVVIITTFKDAVAIDFAVALLEQSTQSEEVKEQCRRIANGLKGDIQRSMEHYYKEESKCR